MNQVVELESTILLDCKSISRRPSLLRSPPSIQLTTCTVHAHSNTTDLEHTEPYSPPSTSSSSSSTSSVHHPIQRDHKKHHYPTSVSRTQHKILLQRQSFLADDKDYLDHPDNMRRLTKELDRVNREYRCLKQFQDPLVLSIQRVVSSNTTAINSSKLYSSSSPQQSTAFLLPSNTRLERRASSNTVHDYLLNFKDERRHSFSSYTTQQQGFMGRIFGGHSPLSSTASSSSSTQNQIKRHHHLQHVA